MSPDLSPYVVAVSGISGSGKSSLVRQTVELLGDAVSMHFDDYASISTYPRDLQAWLEQGADVDAFQTPRLVADLQALVAGAAITLPDGRTVSPAAVVVLEEPFGRLRRDLSALIDVAVYLDVPPDVLLARRLLRRIDEEGQPGGALVEWIQGDLRRHLGLGRVLDAYGAATLAAAADLRLDGTQPLEEVVRTLAAFIRERALS